MYFNRDRFPTHSGVLPGQVVMPAHDIGTPYLLGYVKGDEKKCSVSYRMGTRFKVIAARGDRNMPHS